MEHLKLESITDSPDFWNDPYSISSYCNSILRATKKENEEVSIVVSEYDTVPRVSHEKRGTINKYYIYLPKLKDFYIESEIQNDDIKLRKAFLKHELAHIIFSEMESFIDHHKESEDKIRFMANAIEDVRIENFFGKRFPGANDTFFEVQSKFFKKSRKIIENESPNFKNLALYFLYRSKRFEFEKTFPVEVYDRIFEKYSDFISISQQEVFELLQKISFDFNLELEKEKEKVKEHEDSLPEKQKITINEEDLENYSNIESDNSEFNNNEIEIEDNFPKSNQPKPSLQEEKEEQSKESSDSEQNSKSEEEKDQELEDYEKEPSEEDLDFEDKEENLDSEDSEDSEDDSEDSEDSEDDFSGSGNISNSGQEEDDSPLSSSDFSEMIKEQMKNNIDRENKNIDDFNSDNKEEDIELDSLKEDFENSKKVLDILKLIDYVPDDFINVVNFKTSMTDDFLKYNNSKMKNSASKIVDISRYINLISNSKKIRKNKKTVNQSTRSYYSVIASKNNKNIISLINFFKLKFQDKEKSKRFFNKEVGDLNNESLYKLFSHQDDKRIFSSIEKSIVTKQDVTFLLDFSGSMEGSKIKYLLESLVVLNEVFSKLEIPFNIFSFTGRSPHFNFNYNGISEKTILSNAFNSKYFNQDFDKHTNKNVYFSPKNQNLRDVTFCLLSKNSKTQERKKIINFLLSNVYGNSRSQIWNTIFGGGTPEIQSMIALFNNLPKQKLFLINDGEFDKINLFGKEINQIDSIKRHSMRLIDFYRIGLNLISGKPIYIRTQDEKNLFIQTLRNIHSKCSVRYLRSEYIGNFFTDTVDQQNGEYSKVELIFDSFRNLLYECIYRENLFSDKDVKIEDKYFEIQKTYNSRNDISIINIITKNNLPTFNLKVYNKVVTYTGKKYYNTANESHDILLDKDYIDSILDFYKIICFQNPLKLTEIIERTDISQYTYRDLINKMRNSGWGVFGIGIDSDYGKNYIGDSNFTYVKNYSDIRVNLEKKIKKIIN
jgi:hypothetical protein